MFPLMKYALLLGAVSALAISTSSAAVVWADDFSDSRASAPNPYDYAGGEAGNDYLSDARGNAFTVSGGVLNIADTVSNSPGSGDAVLAVTTSQWSARPTTDGDVLRVSYSIRVNSLLAGGGSSVPRFSIFQNAGTNVNALNANGALVTVGFGYGAFDADVGSDLGFYTTRDPGTGTPAAVGISGGVWADGFDFGNYDSDNAANNNTAALLGNTAEFYRVVIEMREGSTDITGSITNESNPAQTTTFNATAGIALNFKDNSSGLDGIRIGTGQGGITNTDIDNILIEVLPIPEPSSALLVGACGVLGLLRRRRA